MPKQKKPKHKSSSRIRKPWLQKPNRKPQATKAQAELETKVNKQRHGRCAEVAQPGAWALEMLLLLDQISAHFGIVKPKKEAYTQSRNQGIFLQFCQPCPTAAHGASNSGPLVLGHILILFHLRRDQLLITLMITAKFLLFIIGQTFNPSSMNNLEFASTLNTNGSNSLDAWASDAGRQPAVQIQENEVMQVASLCNTVEPAMAGSGHITKDDALELQLFELE